MQAGAPLPRGLCVLVLNSVTHAYTGIKLVLNSRVASVGDGVVNVVDKANNASDIKFGACVWATGVAMNPLIKELQGKLPGQNHFRCVRMCLAWLCLSV